MSLVFRSRITGFSLPFMMRAVFHTPRVRPYQATSFFFAHEMWPSKLFVCREAMFRSSGSSPKAELKPIFHFSSPSPRVSMRVGVFAVICIPEPIFIGSNESAFSGQQPRRPGSIVPQNHAARRQPRSIEPSCWWSAATAGWAAHGCHRDEMVGGSNEIRATRRRPRERERA